MDREIYEKALTIDKDLYVLESKEKSLEDYKIFDFDFMASFGFVFFSEEELNKIQSQIMEEVKSRILQRKAILEKQFAEL